MMRQISKFGLKYCDLPTMLWNASVFLRILTLNIDSKNKKAIPICFYIFTILSFLCYFYAYLVSVLWFVFVRSPQTGQLLAALVVLSLGISSEIGTLKLLYMFLYIDKIRKLTDSFLEFDSHVVQGSRHARNLLKYMRNVKKRAIFYWMVLMVNGILYIMVPLLTPGNNLVGDLLVIYGLEPINESLNYEISCIMKATSVMLICYISANVTGYLIVIVGYAESQMLALNDEIKHVWADAKEQYKVMTNNESEAFKKDYERKNRIINEFVSRYLKDIIKRHAIVKNLFRKVEDVYRGPIAIGFALLILGLIVELLAGLENTYLQLPFAFIQVGMDCFIGQRVIDAGVMFRQAVYDCKWEKFDNANMKLVFTMLQASQRTVAISAGGVTNMSFTFLMAAMRMTYSAYTTLRSVMK